MNTANVFDTDIASFESDVILASQDALVLVDFWADWCGPCKSLGPVLESVVESYGGSVKLAKIDTDRHQELAMQFGIRSLPTVVFFHQGKAVDQFMGVQPEPAIRQLIEKYVTSETVAVVDTAIEMHAAGQVDAARALLIQLLQQNPADERARLVLAGWMLDEGNLPEAEALVEGISEDGQNSPEYRAIKARLELALEPDEGPSTAELQAAVDAEGSNLEARLDLSNRLLREQRVTDALDQLLEIVRQDRDFRDGEARASMLRIFEMSGGTGEMVNAYRRRLASLLN